MTRYDEPEAGDGHGGVHPLAGVPQAALDAARDELEAALSEYEKALEGEDLEAMAHSVLMQGLKHLAWVRPITAEEEKRDNEW